MLVQAAITACAAEAAEDAAAAAPAEGPEVGPDEASARPRRSRSEAYVCGEDLHLTTAWTEPI